jgi:hypothetical protein
MSGDRIKDTAGELRVSAFPSHRPYPFIGYGDFSRKLDVMTSPVGSRRTQHDFVTNDNPKSAARLLFEVRQQYLLYGHPLLIGSTSLIAHRLAQQRRVAPGAIVLLW